MRAILQNGLPGGMPPWGQMGILTADEIEMMASYVQKDPPTPPQLSLEEIIETWQLFVPVAERPIGGLGIHMVRNFVDEMSYERRSDRNVVTLSKRVKPREG